MTIGILTTDLNLIVRSWDPRLAEMTGLTAETVCGLPLTQIVPDLETRGLKERFERTLTEGVVETLSPAFHHYLISCEPQTPSKYFERMQQRVTIAPLRQKETIVGAIVTVEDVTARINDERSLAETLNRTPETNQAIVELQESLRQQKNGEIESLTFVNHPLLAALQEQSWQVRQQAVETLQLENDPQVTAQVLELLRNEHRNASVLNSILQVLSLSNIDTIPALQECLREPDSDLRIYAALALGERKDPRAIPALVGALEDPDKNVRYHAIEALGHLEATEAVEPLMAIAESGDFYLAFPALDALMKIGDSSAIARLLPLLQQSLNWRVRREAVDNLAMENNPQLTQELLRLLREQHRNPNILNSVLQVLVLSNVDPVPSLVECLKDPDPELRIYTALALGERGDRRAIVPLLSVLDDPDTNVRFHTIEALGFLGAIEAVDALGKIAKSGDFFLAFPALESLQRIGDASVAPMLLPLLQDSLLGAQVAEILSKLGDADIVESLAGSLKDQNLPISGIAIAIASIYERYQKTLGEGIHIADLTRHSLSAAGTENLLQAIDKANPEELIAIVTLLSWQEGEGVEAAMAGLLKEPMVREKAVEALVSYGKRGGTKAVARICQMLLEQLDAEDLETRKAAVLTLGRLGHAEIVPSLMHLLEGESELAIAVAGALAQIGDRSSFETLLELLGHPDLAVRLAAIAALNSLGHPAMPERMAALLSNPNPLVRESAVKIAGYFAFPGCIDRLLASTLDPEEKVRRAAIENLPYIENDPGVLEILIRSLVNETPPVRAAAARALGELETQDFLPELLAALQDEEPWVRYYAVKAIGKLKLHQWGNAASKQNMQKAFDTLSQLAQTDTAYQVKAIAADALGKVGGVNAIPILASLAQLEDEEGDVARSAIAALGEIDDSSAVAPLLTALNSTNSERRLDAIRAFRVRGGSEAGVSLQWMAAADPEPDVVEAAIESLSRMATQESIYSLLELTINPRNRDACINALATRGGLGFFPGELSYSDYEYIQAIARGLSHVHAEIRYATVEVLTRLKHPLASELLVSALEDPDLSVRLAAVNALGLIGNRSCEEKLILMSHADPDPSVRRAVQKIIRK